MARHNPNNHDAYQVLGTGLLTGSSWGSYSLWQLPPSIQTTMGVATLDRESMAYAVNAQVAITAHGAHYHTSSCWHVVGRGGMVVTVEQAQAFDRMPCSECHANGHKTIMIATVVKGCDVRERRPYNERLMALADYYGTDGTEA